MYYLGLNAFSHDASAAIVDNEGRIIAAVEEERFTRKKQEDRFPIESIRYCLKEAGINVADLAGIGYAWHPLLLISQRVLWSNIFDYPVPRELIWKNLRKAANAFTIGQHIRRNFGPLRKGIGIKYFPHHKAHAASAFFASSFQDAAYLTIDGRGEWETATWGYAQESMLNKLGAAHHPDSLGNLYSGIARFCGFMNLEKDGTVMALAGCGKPRYSKQFKHLLEINANGSSRIIRLNRDYLDCRTGDAQPRRSLDSLFGIKMRPQGGELVQEYKDIAASLQLRTQEAIIQLCKKIHDLTHVDRLVLAGGVMLNSVANGILRDQTPFKEIFIQPAANDSGLSLGCAYLLASRELVERTRCSMKSASLGPAFSPEEILTMLQSRDDLDWKQCPDIAGKVAEELANGKKVAWFQGRLEFGRRALGNRSILADARNITVRSELNMIKGRESFRPFAISILCEMSKDWLVRGTESPFMLLVDKINSRYAYLVPGAQHVDGSVRIQTVSQEEYPLYHKLIATFNKITGVPLIINTSFNIRGEPLVCNPYDAIETFVQARLDALAIGPFFVTFKQ